MRRLWLKALMLVLSLTFVMGLCGCSMLGKDETKGDVAYTLVGDDDLPEALLRIINEKKNGEFRLTYTNKGKMYIVVGYGEQETGGYSIQVPDIYRTSEAVYVKTVLNGPTEEEPKLKSYPYVVICIDDLMLPVKFL